MVLALLTSSLIGIVSLAITVFLGFTMDGRVGMSQHFLFAMFTTFIVVLAQSMSMFFFIGVGKQIKDLTASSLRYLRRLGVDSVTMDLSGMSGTNYGLQECAQAITEGALMGLYRFDQYKKSTDEKKQKLISFFVGQIMKKSKGKANPSQVNQLLKNKLQFYYFFL